MLRNGLIFSLLILLVLAGTAMAGNQDIYVYVDNGLVNFPDQRPFIDDNNRTLVPVRFPAEEFGAEVEWVGSDDRVDIVQDNRLVSMWLGEKIIEVNGDERSMDTKPILTDKDRTVVPVRFVGEALGVDVEYENIEGKGIVFNFTKGQSEGEKQEIIDEVKEGIEEDGELPEIVDTDKEIPEGTEPRIDKEDVDYAYRGSPVMIAERDELPIVARYYTINDIYIDHENRRVIADTDSGYDDYYSDKLNMELLDEDKNYLAHVTAGIERGYGDIGSYVELEDVAYFNINAASSKEGNFSILLENQDYWGDK